jgi:hypothetical protein
LNDSFADFIDAVDEPFEEADRKIVICRQRRLCLQDDLLRLRTAREREYRKGGGQTPDYIG